MADYQGQGKAGTAAAIVLGSLGAAGGIGSIVWQAVSGLAQNLGYQFSRPAAAFAAPAAFGAPMAFGPVDDRVLNLTVENQILKSEAKSDGKIAAVERAVQHILDKYVPGVTVMPQSSVVTVPSSTTLTQSSATPST
jgi:hypothetical protein